MQPCSRNFRHRREGVPTLPPPSKHPPHTHTPNRVLAKAMITNSLDILGCRWGFASLAERAAPVEIVEGLVHEEKKTSGCCSADEIRMARLF